MIKERGAIILEHALLKTIKRKALETLNCRQKLFSPVSAHEATSEELSEFIPTPTAQSQPTSSMVARAQLPPKKQPRLLPPIYRPTSVDTDFKPIDEKKEYTYNKQRPSKRGFLLIGDIVCLQAKDLWIETEKGSTKYTGIISGDGITKADMECVPKHSFTSSTHEVRWQFRQSLFRIEPARQYGFRALYESYNELETQEPSVLEELHKQAEEEHEGNEAELELSYGRSVTYGERIQLRHIHSDSFVTTSLDVAQEHGCLKVVLNEYGNEGSWFELMPSNKLRQEGEPVRYSDTFTFISTAEKSRYYLHMAVSQVFSKDVSCELNASDTMSYWQAIRYTNYLDVKEDDGLLASGDSFRIYHKQSEGYLSVLPAVIKMPEINIEDEIETEVDKQEYLIAPKSEVIQNDMQYQVYIDYTPSSLNLWEIERECPFIGGIAKHDEFFRIKHVSTGKFLSINTSEELELNTDGDAERTLFMVNVEDDSFQELKFNTLVRIQSKLSNKFIHADKEGFNFTSYFSEQPIKTKLKVSITENYKEKISTAFMLIDEFEDQSLHIYQISRILPTLIEYYKFLQIWGTFLKKEGRMLSTATARDSELELEEDTDNILVILNNLKIKILKDSDPSKESMILRQNTIRDSGLLDFLLQLAQLIQKRVKIRSLKDSEKKESPQLIAMKYLDKLSKRIYETIYYSIKDNVTSCNYLYKYDLFLSSQLNNYKKEVGLILKVTFKYSVDIFKGLKNIDFKGWVSQVTDISSCDYSDNMAEQTLILKILAYLCCYNDVGVSKYQELLREYLLIPRLLEYIEFDKYQTHDCIIIKPFKCSNSEFISKNPALDGIIKFKVPGRIDSGLLILLKDLENSQHTRKYLDYFTSLIDLIANLCLSRNTVNIEYVIQRLHLKFDSIYDCISSSLIHCKLREVYLKLMRVLYIDVDPYRKVTQSINRCYVWNSNSSTIEPYILSEGIKEIYNMQMITASDEQIKRLRTWVESVWRGLNSPFSRNKEETAEQKIKFITELMNMTGDLLDLKLADYKFMVSIYSPLVKILMTNSSKEKSLVKTKDNWISILKDQLNSKFKDKAELRDKIILATLKVFKIASYIRTNKQIEAFITKITDFNSTKPELDSLEAKLFIDLDYNYNRQLNEKDRSTAMIFQAAFLSYRSDSDLANQDATALLPRVQDSKVKLQKVVPDSGFSELITGMDDLHLDVFLLDLLFSSRSKEIERNALELIIKNFNQRSNLKKELQEVLFIHKPEIIVIYHNLKEIRCYLELKFKNLRMFDDLLTSMEAEKDEETIRSIQSKLEYAVLDLRSYIQKLRKLLNIYEESEKLVSLQSICRNLSIHETFLMFLSEEFHWIICDENGVRSVENKSISELYNDVYMVLQNFCYNNYKNQMLLYRQTGTIMSLYGNISYSNLLMCTILDCHKTSVISEKIIEYVFTVLDMSEDASSRPQDLRMLRFLIFDSAHGSIFPNTQTNIIKAIFSSKMLKNWYNSDEGLNTEKFYDKNLEFNYQLLMLLVACSIENRFAVLQCRRMIPYAVVIKELYNPSLPLRVKKAMLHYIFYIFYLDLEDGLPAEQDILKLEELLENLVLKDLNEFRRYLTGLINISRKGLYLSVFCKQAEENKLLVEQSFIENAKKMFLEKIRETIGFTNLRQPRGATPEDLTKEESDALKYWVYLTNTVDWKINLETGLLFFLKDLSSKLKSKEVHLTQEFVNILERIRSVIHEIHDEILVLKNRNKDLDFDILISLIRDIMIEIPYYVGDNPAHTGETEKQCFEIVVSKLEKYIEDSYLSFDDFVSQKLCASEANVISRNVLLRNLKDVLGLDVTSTQLDRMMTYLDPENIREISISELIAKLKDHFRSNPILVRRNRNSIPQNVQEELVNPNALLTGMIVKVNEQLFTVSSKKELNNLVLIVKSNIVDKALDTDNYTELFNFTKNLESAFSNKESKIYLIEIFIRIIKSGKELYTEGDEDEKSYKKMIKHIQSIQNVLNNSGICDMAVSLIHKDNDPQLTYKATKLLNSMLEFNNMEVKRSILNYLKESGNSFQLFSYIKNMLRESRDRINEETQAIKSPNKSKNKFSFNKYSTRIAFSSVLKGKVDKAKLTMNLLMFLQRCCDNCYLEFQNYIREQGESDKRVSVDLVSEMGNFLINLQDISNIRSLDANWDDEAVMLASLCLKTLTDSCSGPCQENQKILGNRRRLYKFINWLLKGDPLDFNSENIDSPYVSILNDAIVFLNALLEGEIGQDSDSKSVSDTMMDVLELKECMKHCTNIYSKLIKNREEFIYQDDTIPSVMLLKPFEISGSKLTKREHEIIETGFHISILFLTLEDKYPTEFKYKFNETVEQGAEIIHFKSKAESKSSINKLMNISRRRDTTGISDSMLYHFKNLWKLFKGIFSNQLEEAGLTSEQIDMQEAYKFYSSNIASVELNYKGSLTRILFHIPSMCKFMTQKTRRDIIFKANRNTHQEKIEDFFKKTKLYEVELKHQQNLARYPMIDRIASRWSFYANISFLVVVVLNITLLFSIEHDSGRTGEWSIMTESKFNTSYFLLFLSIVQIILAGLIYCSYLIDNFPMIVYINMQKTHKSKMDQYLDPKFERIKGMLLMHEIISRTKEENQSDNTTFIQKVICMFTDFECMYNLIYLIISIISWVWYMWYAILLLDIVRRSDDLVNVLKSITLNYKQLILTMVLGVIVIYLFSIVAFLNFSKFYVENDENADANTYCDTLIHCFASSLMTGVRAGGGIGEWLGQAKKDEDEYWTRMLFDLGYFIVVIIILMNIIFGIIIDTFAELRDRRKAEMKDIKENCFICGNDKFQFEVKRLGWNQHVQMEHNVYSYLAFILYIKRKPIQDCNGAEKFVKERISLNDVIFFPRSSISLQNFEQKEEELAHQESKNIRSALEGVKDQIDSISSE